MEMRGSTAQMGWRGHYGSSASRTVSAKHPDPTMVSLTRAEFDRLLNIESTAEAAFETMCDAPVREKKFSDAEEALDFALHSPMLGG